MLKTFTEETITMPQLKFQENMAQSQDHLTMTDKEAKALITIDPCMTKILQVITNFYKINCTEEKE